METRDGAPRFGGGDGPRRGRARACNSRRVGWATWTLCGMLTGLTVGISLWHGRAAEPADDNRHQRHLPAAAAGITIQPGTVWVALATRTYYKPDQSGFARHYPGVFMQEADAIARGCWPSGRP